MSISKWWDIFKNYLIHLKKWKKIKLFSGCRDREQNLVLYWGDCVCLLEMFLFLLSLQLLMMMIIIIKRFCFVFLHFAPLPSLPTWIVLLCPGPWWGKKFNSFAIKDFVMRFFLLFLFGFFFTKTSWTHSQPCWLFFLMILTESRLVCFSLTDLIKL